MLILVLHIPVSQWQQGQKYSAYTYFENMFKLKKTLAVTQINRLHKGVFGSFIDVKLNFFSAALLYQRLVEVGQTKRRRNNLVVDARAKCLFLYLFLFKISFFFNIVCCTTYHTRICGMCNNFSLVPIIGSYRLWSNFSAS